MVRLVQNDALPVIARRLLAPKQSRVHIANSGLLHGAKSVARNDVLNRSAHRSTAFFIGSAENLRSRYPPALFVLTARALRPPGAAITFGVAAGCAVTASLGLVPGGDGILGGGLALLMLLIAAIDRRYYIVPDELTLCALVLGFAHVSIMATGDIADGLTAAFFRGVTTATVFFVLRTSYRYLRGHDGIGLGDVKLAGVAGVWLDWMAIPLAIEIAALAGLALYAARYGVMRQTTIASAKVPFGLFFAPSIWIGWLLLSQSYIFY